MSTETYSENANTEAASQGVTTQKQALRTLDQLGAYLITEKSKAIKRREPFASEVLKTLSLYRSKVSKAEEARQFNDIVEAAKNELQAIFERHQAEG